VLAFPDWIGVVYEWRKIVVGLFGGTKRGLGYNNSFEIRLRRFRLLQSSPQPITSGGRIICRLKL
jgi:hypothetical protein